MKFLLRAAVLATAAVSLVMPAAAADTCSVASAAGKAEPPVPTVRDPGKFRIFWHIATQVEDLADADKDPAKLKDIRDVQKIADGYYMNMLITGPLVYWPGRPKQCATNFKRIDEGDSLEITGDTFSFPEGGGAGRNECEAKQAEFQEKAGFDSTVALQHAAMKRVMANLDIAREQNSGKEVIGVLIINGGEMAYDGGSDSIKLKQLPKTMCFFNSVGFAPNSWMTYQEPNIQMKKGVFVWVPRMGADGKPVKSKNPKADKAPENPRVYDLVENAFEAADVPFGDIYANMRKWNRRQTPELAKQLASMPEIRGFSFEGGASVPVTKAHKIENYSAGIAWILKNTDKNVSILMPGYWDRADIGSEDEIDTLPERTRDYVRMLNEQVSKKMGLAKGQNAFCTGRLILIPGSYGKPLHVKTLPSMRKGKYAGTVTGEIRILNDLRNEMCGG
jgi:hypothetical protein